MDQIWIKRKAERCRMLGTRSHFVQSMKVSAYLVKLERRRKHVWERTSLQLHPWSICTRRPFAPEWCSCVCEERRLCVKLWRIMWRELGDGELGAIWRRRPLREHNLVKRTGGLAFSGVCSHPLGMTAAVIRRAFSTVCVCVCVWRCRLIYNWKPPTLTIRLRLTTFTHIWLIPNIPINLTNLPSSTTSHGKLRFLPPLAQPEDRTTKLTLNGPTDTGEPWEPGERINLEEPEKAEYSTLQKLGESMGNLENWKS